MGVAESARRVHEPFGIRRPPRRGGRYGALRFTLIHEDDGVAFADDAVFEDSAADAAAEIGHEGGAQALVDLVHQAAGVDFDLEIDFDVADADAPADQMAHRIGIHEDVGPTRVPGQIRVEFAADFFPL